jgi:glycosyltransferase involved in cell wall biosynthesis
MKIKLQEKYGIMLVSVLSNLVLLWSDIPKKKEIKLRTIGFLSNITKEKGGWEVIRLAEAIRKRGWPIKLKVAGPCEDLRLLQSLQNAHDDNLLEWIGPVYAKQRDEFWSSIDLFVFPTNYKNEAEPLVVWEALLFENPVLAYDRGCISTQVGSAGKIISKSSIFVASAMEQLELWQENPQLYKNCVRDAAKIKESLKGNIENQWKEFLLMLRG